VTTRHVGLPVTLIAAVALLTACGSGASSSSTVATSSPATTTGPASSPTGPSGAMLSATCPSATSVSAALGGTFTLKTYQVPDSSSVACSYISPTGGGAQISYSVAATGAESMVKSRLRAIASILGSAGRKTTPGIGDTAYTGSTTIGTGVVDASAVYAIKGLKTLLLVASAPRPKVEAYARHLLG